MRLLSFRVDGRESFGVVSGDGVIDLGARGVAPTLAGLLAAGSLDEARAVAASATPDVGVDAIRFQPPIPRPAKILCVGINYAERHEEYGDQAPPAYPSIFMRTPGSFVGHLEPLVQLLVVRERI